MAGGIAAAVAGLMLVAPFADSLGAQGTREWPIHATDRPQPPVVDPGAGALPVPPPKDAIVLFDGRDLAGWQHGNGEAAKWIVRDGYFEVRAGTGDLKTRAGFGDVQLRSSGPHRRRRVAPIRTVNSGVFPDGEVRGAGARLVQECHVSRRAGGVAVRAVSAPVNVSRPPGAWQSYDIVFRPRFDDAGRLVRPAIVTVPAQRGAGAGSGGADRSHGTPGAAAVRGTRQSTADPAPDHAHPCASGTSGCANSHAVT